MVLGLFGFDFSVWIYDTLWWGFTELDSLLTMLFGWSFKDTTVVHLFKPLADVMHYANSWLNVEAPMLVYTSAFVSCAVIRGIRWIFNGLWP